jgi:F-type H+-transporting ATPase subunit epsilon
MSAPTLHLTIVTQDRKLVELQVDSVTAPTSAGTVTVLPQHVALFAPLTLGELVYRVDSTESSVVVNQGFIDVGPDSKVTVMVDAAVADREISEQKAEEAVAQARSVLVESRDRAELVQAEASLRRALLELRVAQKTKKTQL